MATIPLIGGDPETLDLSFGTDMTEDYRVGRVDFGDNLSQRWSPGLNPVRQQWRLVWTGISDDDAEVLRLFFRGLKGVGLVEWAPYAQEQSKL